MNFFIPKYSEVSPLNGEVGHAKSTKFILILRNSPVATGELWWAYTP